MLNSKTMAVYSVYNMFIFFVCSFGAPNRAIGVSYFNSTDLKFIQATQLNFCGIIKRCDKNMSLNDSELTRIFEFYKAIIPFDDSRRPEAKCCKGCSCNLATCQEYGTCCTDILTSETVNSDIYNRYTCESAQLIPREWNGDMLWMITICAEGFGDVGYKATIKDKCENWKNYSGLESAIPVTDKISHITYRNRYCMECNNRRIENALTWTARLVCYMGEESEFLQNVLHEDFLDAVKSTKLCNVIYDRPKGATFHQRSCSEPKIKDCNVTGLWAVYDPFIEAACQLFTSVFNYEYKNIFCYMCNEVKIPLACSYPNYGGEPFFPSFSSLLKLDEDKSEVLSDSIVTRNCTYSQIYDEIKNICRNLTCRFPRSLKEGKCVNMVETLAGVTYLMYIKLTPLTQTTLKGQDLLHLMNALVVDIDNKLSQIGVANFIYIYTLLYKVSVIGTTNVTTEHIRQPSGANTIPTVSPDSQLVYVLFRIGIHVGAKTSVDVSVLDDILGMDGANVTVEDDLIGMNQTFNSTLDDYSVTDKTFSTYVNVRDISDNTPLHVFLMRLTSPHINELYEERKPIILVRKLTCPLVQVGIGKDGNITIGYNSIHVYGEMIKTKDFYKLAYRNYLICADSFLHALNNAKTDSVFTLPSNELTVKQILSMTLFIFSVVCSFFTFATYSLFSKLRTQPGLNNMCLVLNLIIAQLLFQFGVAQADRIPGWACKTIGVLVHFFWLMVVFWMNVCSFHIFTVFAKISKIQQIQRTNRFKKTFVYNVYCALFSALFVIINIMVETLSSAHERFGYGLNVCYISSRKMYVYVLTLPILLTVSVNFILFVIVVFRISRMPTVESNIKSNRNYFFIYTKLASITGISWLFGVLFYFTDIEAFEYIFIIFNAGQGVFIFFSFICNKRVYYMYKTLLKKKKLAVAKEKSLSTSTKESTNNNTSTKESTNNSSSTKESTNNSSSTKESTNNSSSTKESTNNSNSTKESTNNSSSTKESTNNSSTSF